MDAKTKILESAKKIFTEKGIAGARMQEIADGAMINKAMLHYYFKSKQALFNVILMESLKEFIMEIDVIINGDFSIFEIIEKYVEKVTESFLSNPNLPLFVLNEISKDQNALPKIIFDGKQRLQLDKFKDNYAKHIEKGLIRNSDPERFFLHMISLTVYPIIAKPIVMRVLKKNEIQYLNVIRRRKEDIIILLKLYLNPISA